MEKKSQYTRHMHSPQTIIQIQWYSNLNYAGNLKNIKDYSKLHMEDNTI